MLKVSTFFCLPFLLFFLVSCSTTKVSKSWKDDNRSSFKINKALIIFVTEHAPVREAFEDAFVAKLQRDNIKAYASYKVLLNNEKIDKESVLQKINSLGVDSVIVTNVLDAKEKKVFESNSPYSIPYSQFNIKLFEENMEKYGKDQPSGYIAMFDEVALKTTVFAADSQKPVWFLKSNLLLQDTFNKLVDSYLNVIVAQLHKDQII